MVLTKTKQWGKLIDHFVKNVSFCFCFLSSRDYHPISLYRLFNETSLVVPVAILAASFRILSSSYLSCNVELFHITSPYSNNGLIKAVFIISKDFLSKLNFNFLKMFTLNLALSWI